MSANYSAARDRTHQVQAPGAGVPITLRFMCGRIPWRCAACVLKGKP